MLELDATWTSTGSSGGLTGVELRYGCAQSVLTAQFSTLATTNSFSLQTAQDSTGPWLTEATEDISTAVQGQVAIRVTGPYKFARPFIHTESTGTYRFRLTAVS